MPSFNQKLEAAIPALGRYALSLTADRTRADDLVQDCVERALRKRLLYVGNRDIVPWLMRIMINLYRNQLRVQSPLQGNEPDESLGDPLAHARTEDRLALADTLSAIQSLPEDQRQALLTVVVGGLDYRDAAKALDIPIGTLMSRLHRARTKLSDYQTNPPEPSNLVTLTRRPQ